MPTRANPRNAYLLKTYGITEAQYNEILRKQNNSCAICDRPRKEFPRNFAVDHDHKTGAIRGLLCAYCNHRVVGRHRDPELLRKVADYVSQHTGFFVPEKPKKKRKKRKCSR